MTSIPQISTRKTGEAESAYAWVRLFTALAIGTVGSVGMWSVVVALPAVQAEFAVARADASLPFTLAMIGFGVGAVAMGRLADRFGITVPILCGAAALCVGYICASFAPNLWMFTLASGLSGFGTSATFAPLLADLSHWFTRHRGIAVTIVASGNYLAGTVWPPIVQHFIETSGWRATHFGIGLFCVATMSPLAFVLLRRVATHTEAAEGVAAAGALSACAGFSMTAPENGSVVRLGAQTTFVVVASPSMTGLQVKVDGNDVTNQITDLTDVRAQGQVTLPVGTHGISATATVPCWHCFPQQ